MSAETSPVPVIEALDVTHAYSLIMEGLARGILQVGKPLSLSIAGRTVSYGSAQEAILFLEAMMRVEQKMAEHVVRNRPYSLNHTVRG